MFLVCYSCPMFGGRVVHPLCIFLPLSLFLRILPFPSPSGFIPISLSHLTLRPFLFLLSVCHNSLRLAPPPCSYFALCANDLFTAPCLTQGYRCPTPHHAPLQPSRGIRFGDHQRGLPCVRGRGRCHQGVFSIPLVGVF